MLIFESIAVVLTRYYSPLVTVVVTIVLLVIVAQRLNASTMAHIVSIPALSRSNKRAFAQLPAHLSHQAPTRDVL